MFVPQMFSLLYYGCYEHLLLSDLQCWTPITNNKSIKSHSKLLIIKIAKVLYKACRLGQTLCYYLEKTPNGVKQCSKHGKEK